MEKDKKASVVGQVPEKLSQRRRVPKLPLILIAVLIGFGGAYALVRSFADTPVQTNCFASPHTCGYPDATNTGVPAGTPLTPSGSITITQDNTTIQNMHVTGTISIQANNVTIKNTLVTYAGKDCGTENACGNSAIQIGTAGSPDEGIPDKGYTGININNVETAPSALGSNGKVTATCEHDIRSIASVLTVDSSYLHACDSNLYSTKDTTFNKVYGIAKIDIANDHIENIYFNNSKFTLKNSTLLNPVEQTAVIFGNVNTGGGGACQNTLNVDSSLLAGSGYVLYPCGNASGAGSSSVSITNNRFARCFGTPNHDGDTVCDGGSDTHGYYPYVGSYDLLTGDYNTTWSGNILDDNGQTCTTNASNSCAKSAPSGGYTSSTSDTTAPSTPSGVKTTTPSSTEVDVSWGASTDTGTKASGVAGYNVFRGGTKLNSAIVTGTTYKDTTVSPSTTYQYTVQAVDNAGNASSMSSSVSATTLAAQTGGTGGGTTGGGTACTPATSSATLTSVFNSATSGTVICLAAGSYSFSGGLKTGTPVTIQPQDGVTKGQVTMTVNFSAASGITINGVTVANGSRISGSKTKNITIENSDFPGQITLDASTLANANILFNNNVHHDFNATGDQEGRIFVPGGDGRPTVGITIENSQFLNGNSDGIQNGANGLHIGPGNVFSGIVQVDSSSGVHADSIQLYGSQNTTIEGNYFHNDEDGIMCADGCDHEVVTNNVFAITGSAFAITWLSDNGSSITHNTFVNGSSCSYGPCGIIAFGNKSSDPVSTGTTLKDNVLTSYEVLSGAGTTTGLASGAEGNNLLVNNPKAGPPSPSSTDIIGSPTYVGGANPSNYAGYALACGSLGKGNASDGTDRGINVSGAAGCGGGTGADTMSPSVLLTAPVNGKTVSGTITASANASDNVGVSKVEFYLDNATSPIFTAPATSTGTYLYSVDTSTLSNASHTITAEAYDAAGNHSSSASTFTVSNPDKTPPTVPTNVSATPTSATSVNLSWKASTDPCPNTTGSNTPASSCPGATSGVAKYNVFRGTVVIAQVTGTSYTDTSVVADTSYSYTIQAVDGAGNASANSAAATATTPKASGGTAAPTTPTNLQATATSASQVTLTWDASTDVGGPGLAGYNVYRNGDKLNSSPINTTSYGDSTVNASTSYTYTVKAVDGAGNSSPETSGVSVTTPPVADTKPTTPTKVKATAINSTEVDVTWTASTDTGGPGLAGYNIYRNGAQLNTAPVTGAIYKDVKVSPSTSYQYVVQAIDIDGNTSDKTSSVSVTTPAGPTTGNGNDLLLGNKAIQASPDNDAAGSPEAFKYTAVASGQASSIGLYVDTGSSATTLSVGLYADDNGTPGTLLATGTLNSLAASSWNLINLKTKPAITKGTSYWIAVLGVNGRINFRDAASGNCSQSPVQNNLASLPADWTVGPIWHTCTVSAYVSNLTASEPGGGNTGGSTGGGTSSGGSSSTPTAPITITVTGRHGKPIAGATVTIGGQTAQTNSSGIATFTNVPTGKQSVTIQSGTKTNTKSVNVSTSSGSNSATQHVTLSLTNANLSPALLLIPVVALLAGGLIIFRPWSGKLDQAIAGAAPEEKIVSSSHAEIDTDKPGRKLETPGAVYEPEKQKKDK